MSLASDNVFPKLIESMQTSDPAAPADSTWKIYAKAGGIYARSSNAVVGPFGASTGMTNPMTTKGDVILGDTGGTPTRLGAGTSGYVLTSAGAAAFPTWSATAGEFATTTAAVATSQTTTSTSFTDLATAGPSVTVTVGASGKVRITVTAMTQNTSAVDCYVGIVISGANTVAAATYMVLVSPANINIMASRTKIISGLSTGSTTFKMQYAVDSGTGSFQLRDLIVEPVF